MASRGKKASGRRNLLILIALVLIVGVLAISARFLQSERVYIQVTGPEELAQRAQSPENSFPLLFEALEMRLQIAPELQQSAHELNRELGYRPRSDELPPQLYAAWREDPAHPLRAYAEAGGAVADKVHEALQRPYFLFPDAVGAFEDRPEDFRPLLALLALRALWLLDQGAVEAGMSCLLDMQELARRLSSYDRYWNRSIISAQLVLQVFEQWLQAQQDLETIALVQARLVAGRPYPTKAEALETQWLRLDETVAGPRTAPEPPSTDEISEEELAEIDASPRIGRRMGMRFFINQVVKTSNYFIANRGELLDMAEGPTSELTQTLENAVSGGFFSRGAEYVMRQVARYVEESALWGTRYESLVAWCAVRRFQLETGALPENADALAPDYLDGMPIEPYNGRPLGYQLGDAAAVLYHFGYNASDEQAAGDDVVLARIPM